MKIYYNSELKELSRKLRKSSTLSEVLLWNQLKGRKMKGYLFARQKPISNYIVDFYCPKLRLVIEIDGLSHDGKDEQDSLRQQKLESLGHSFLRFGDLDVKQHMDGVLAAIGQWVDTHVDQR